MSRRFQGEGFNADSLRFAVWIGLIAIGLHAQPARAELPGLETTGDLEEMVEEAWNNALIAPPGNEPYETHLGVFLFGSQMDTNFLSALLPVTNGACVFYPVEVVETNTSPRQRLFLNLTNGIAWAASISATNYPEGWIEQKYGSPPAWLSGTNLTQWVAERDPSRCRIRLELLSAGDEPAYLEALTNAVLQQTGEEPPVNLCEVYSNQLAIVAHREGAGGIELYLHAPTGVVALTVLRSTNLLEGCGWRLQTTLLHTVNPFRWLDSGPEAGAFVTFGNAWADSDGDGLGDILESYVYGTDPNHQDSDGDGWSDGYEVFTTGTYPWGLNDRDGDGVGDGVDPEPDTPNTFVELSVTTNFPAWTWPGQSFTMTPALPTNAVMVTTKIRLFQQDQTSVNIQGKSYFWTTEVWYSATTVVWYVSVLRANLTGPAIPDQKTGIFTMTPIDNTSSSGSGTIIWTYKVVPKVEMVNAWERDDVCNRVPNPKQNTDNRLFVATEGSGQAEITVKSSIQPAGIEDKVLCAVYDGSTHLVSDAFSAACEAALDFTPTGPANNYSLNVGIDANGNGTLESSEFCSTVTNFDVTAFTSAHYDDEEDYLNDQASSWMTGWAYPVGSSLLLHFLNDPSPPLAFDSTTTVSINCFTQSNLTHNAGETFAPSGAGTLEEVGWNAGSDAGEKIAKSDEVETIINAILTAHSAEVTAYFVANPTATSYAANWTSNNVPVNFAQTGYLPLAGYDLHIAFGNATLPSITVDVVVKKGLFGDLYIDSLIVTGSLTDLYDFNYEDGGLAARAAVLQIGWDPDITGRDAGNIFFDRVNYQETFDDWDFDY